MRKGFASIIVILAVVVVAAIVGMLLLRTPEPWQKSPAEIQQRGAVLSVGEATTTVSSSTATINISTWKTFTAPMEGFAIEYPPNWTIEDTTDGNCGFSASSGSACKDRYDFVSPDGLRVRYVIDKEENSDRAACGQQAPCLPQTILGVDSFNVPNLGNVYLVKLDNEVFLHDPVDSQTVPIVGQDQHPGFAIDFSLPSRSGGRYALFVTTFWGGKVPPQSPWFANMTSDQFYDLQSVREGIMILKSLSYPGYPTISACMQATGEQCVRSFGDEVVPSNLVARDKLVQCEKILPTGFFPVSLIAKYNICMGSSTEIK
jgi:hypothetical protein